MSSLYVQVDAEGQITFVTQDPADLVAMAGFNQTTNVAYVIYFMFYCLLSVKNFSR